MEVSSFPSGKDVEAACRIYEDIGETIGELRLRNLHSLSLIAKGQANSQMFWMKP